MCWAETFHSTCLVRDKWTPLFPPRLVPSFLNVHWPQWSKLDGERLGTRPSHHPTVPPSHRPTIPPSHHPTIPPSHHPTIPPSHHPTISPSHHPTIAPSHHPTISAFSLGHIQNRKPSSSVSHPTSTDHCPDLQLANGYQH